MSKILANQIANYGDDAPIEIKEGLNIPAGKPIQAAGVSGTSGQVLTSTGTSISWTTPFSGSYNDLTNKPTIPAAQVNSDWNATSGAARILNKPVIPPQPSLVVNAAGTPSLTYNSVNGQFTYTPPDLSDYDTAYGWGDHAAAGYVTSSAIANSSNWDTAYGWGDHSLEGYLTSYTETDPVFAASPASDILSGDITNWDTAYGWGDHSTEGYLTSLAVEDLSNVDITGGLADQQILKWDASTSSWKPANDLVGGSQGVALTDLSVTVAAAGSPNLSYNNTNGVFTYTPPNLSGYLTAETDPLFSASPAATILSSNIANWDSAHGWGDHALEGYLVASATDKTNWNTAYGWGDHSTEGYLTSVSVALNDVSDVTITSPSNGEVLTYNGSGWVNSAPTGGGGGANVTISDTAPGVASSGDLWWESDKGRLKIYYQDVDSSQWVDASPPLQQDRIATSAAPATATSTGTAGEIRYDSGYVYICVATNTWKRAALATW